MKINLDELCAQYQDYQIYDLWHWESGDWCSEDGFDTQEECRQDFEQFIPTLLDGGTTNESL